MFLVERTNFFFVLLIPLIVLFNNSSAQDTFLQPNELSRLLKDNLQLNDEHNADRFEYFTAAELK